VTERTPRLFVVVVAPLTPAAAAHAALLALLGEDEVHTLGGGAWLAYSERYDAAALRDALAPHADGAALFVAEFERWSAAGEIDSAWLSHRGH
jgi:hypothetical protein